MFQTLTKVERDGADVTLSGRLFQMVGQATGKAANGRQFHGRHRQKVAVKGRDCRHSLFFLDSQESLTLVSAAHTLLLN